MYVVAGATGQTGKAVADALLAAGQAVTVLARDEGKASAWKAKGARIAVADLGDEAALARALSGAAGAYLLTPPAYGLADPVGDRRRLAASIGRAVASSGVPHVVLLSSTGAHRAEGTGMILAPRAGEEAIAPAAGNATVLRAAYFLENWAMVLGAAKESGVLPTFLTAGRRIPMVATKDIGSTAAAALLGPASGRRVIELAGPEDYSPDDIARILAPLLGRDVRTEEAPIGAVVPAFRSFGMSEGAARLFAEMYAAINEGRADFEGRGNEFRRGTTGAAEVFRAILGA